MSKKSLIDQIRIDQPCSQDWATMKGNDRIRFCDHCSKHVSDLSVVTRKEAKKIVRASGGNICIRYIQNPITNQPVFVSNPVQIRRRTPLFAAGVVSATLSLSTLTYAQGGLKKAEAVRPQIPSSVAELVLTEEKHDELRRTVSGSVVDPNGALIPNATLTLTGDKESEIRRATANGEGVFRLENVLPGKYILQGSAPGFKDFTSVVEVPSQADTSIDIELGVGGVEIQVDVQIEAQELTVMGGAMAVVEYASSLVRAVANGDIEEVMVLLAKGENVDGKTKDDVAVISPLSIAVEDNELDIARLLLENGANVNATDSEKRTPLMMLDEEATVELVNLLLSYGASLDPKDEDGNTALIFAAENSNAEVVAALIRANPSINETNEEGRTALMEAANADDVEMVRSLLAAGADVNLNDEDGDTAYDLTSSDEIEKLLVRHGYKPSTDESESSDSGGN